MTLRTDAELDEALAALAAEEGISKQEAVRRAVMEKRDRQVRRQRVDLIASELIVEYDDALRRLGTV
ncbi:ribbon-helix-helix protein, CopG family [Nocardioides daejeonensis]|uniref:ribbon-helix-helix protein, CopG family n=1 Tax=Nocardioides daejeonensis TaxID=1046556 RepID=UPI00195204B2|nr:ribbon-helix-helix protein, CopG family [Nocardioides daejeonensis]